MPIDNKQGDLFKGFSKLNRKQRFARLITMGVLTHEDVNHLKNGNAVKPTLAEKLIENVIGYFHMPLGVATNFRINNRDYVIPMAVEETSIVAAASKTAKWLREAGKITTKTLGENIIGQIQVANVNDYARFESLIMANKTQLIDSANQHVAYGMVKRGGGVKDILCRKIIREGGTKMAVLHVLLNSGNAMGANAINQVCEFLKQPIEDLTQETVTMCILSNLADTKLTQAHITIHNIDPELGKNLEEASIFAELDPYRATTNNKGALNGMDAVLLATGNDWRAVEAGVHAYAARSGQYRSITQWRIKGRDLIGTLTAPIMVGTVGGVTTLHPTAQICLKMLNITEADELAQVVAAVGLVQNLGAIRALTTVGIIQGHMKLHISNLSLSAGATKDEMPLLEQRLRKLLEHTKRISLENAKQILAELRVELRNATTKCKKRAKRAIAKACDPSSVS